MTATHIDLGLASPVRLGKLTLHPAVRTIRHDDGRDEVVEPRVMQVLLALAEKRGDIVRREELTERCWEGRVVGEDAINRVLSRLRRVAEGIGADSFRIETITRIGYRLVALDEGMGNDTPPTASPLGKAEAAAPVRASRRTVLAGVAVAVGVAAAGGGLWWELHRAALPQAAREAMERGMEAFRGLSLEELTTAAAAFHQAAELAPDAAEPWGSLALVYSFLYSVSHGQEAALDVQRARDAAGKSLRLNPDNCNAQTALAGLQPLFRNWLNYDAACKPVIEHYPDQVGIGIIYTDLLANVGRIRGVNDLARRLVVQDPLWPTLHANLVLSSWCLGRFDDADAAMDRAFQQWPRRAGLWFIRQRLLAYTGRAAAAVAMVEDADHRPVGLPAWDFELTAAESRALLTRSKADIDAAAALYWPRARTSVGVAGNAIEFFAATGRLDDALAILNALYFNRGFDVGTRNFTEEQGTYSERRNRPTWHFWFPHMAELRADPRLATIVEEVGLVDYWRKSGNRPDFAIAGLPAA